MATSIVMLKPAVRLVLPVQQPQVMRDAVLVFPPAWKPPVLRTEGHVNTLGLARENRATCMCGPQHQQEIEGVQLDRMAR